MKQNKRRNFLVLVIAMFFVGQVNAAAEVTAAKILEKLQKAHDQRIDSDGAIIEDAAMIAEFNAAQRKAIADLKKHKLLGHSFNITNSFKSEMVVTVSTVQEKNGMLAGTIVESSYYKDDLAEAAHRAVGLVKLRNGMDAMLYEGQSLAMIQAEPSLAADKGGLVAIHYPTDFKKGEYAQETLNVLKSMDGKFAFYREDRSGFSSAHLDIWINIFTRNFGIQEVWFQ